MVRQPLVIPCDLGQKACGGPVKIRGEGRQLTVLVPGANMTAMLEIEPGAMTTDRDFGK